ncbi:MAG: UDP-glucose:(heptosyl)LPS alpha-1,3-glucosyltransferase [Bacteriovoracaceae bacterium]|jgi:UDP-glucose:(heptosyl)LPS alpha-1,3-glucosyltransferase
MPKTILISQKDINVIRSGVPRLVLSEIKFFKNKGHNAYAIAERIKEDAVIIAGGTPYKTYRWPISGFFRRKFYMKRVAKAAQSLKPDLIIGHGDIINQDICFIHNCVHLAFELINGKKLPIDHEVGKIHSEILTTKNFKVLVCNSEMMKHDLTSRFNLEGKKIVVHYPELNSKQFGQSTANIRDELKIAKDTIVIGLITSGNFKKRNVKLLLEAIYDLPKEKNLHILIAGKDKSEPFRELIEKSNHPITFLPPTDEVEKYYNSVDIFVLPAHIEEFGMSVLEVMACKKPVIVNKMVGSSEILEGRSKGFILQELSKDNLAKKITTLVESSELRLELGELNYTTAMKYSTDNQDEKFELLLNEIGFDL